MKVSDLKLETVTDFLKKVDKKTWVKIGIALAVLMVFLFVFAWPAWILRPQIKRQFQTIRGQMMTTEALFRKKPELLKNKEEFLAFTKNAKERIYQPGESALLLGAISKLAQDSKVSIIASSPKNYEGKFPPPFDQQYEGNLYSFTVEGGYHDLADFISRIESNPKLLRVSLFRILWREESPKLHQADVTLSAVSLKKGRT